MQVRLFRSSSMGSSVDSLIKPIKIVKPDLADKKQTNAANSLKPTAENVGPLQIAKKDPTKKSVFTLGDEKSEDDRKGHEGFLDACSLCKKKIAHNQDIYMYGYFQTFCSPECRDDKIALNEKFKSPSPVWKQTINNLERNLLKIRFDK